jgi:hypothetical protein
MVLQLRVATYRKAERQRSEFMEKTFTYYLEDETKIEYTPHSDDLKDAIVEEIFWCYFNKEERELFNTKQRIAIKKALRNLTDDNDNWETLLKDFEENVKDFFEDKAKENYKYRED